MASLDTVKHRNIRAHVNTTETNAPAGDLLQFILYKKGTILLTHIQGNYQLRPDSPKTQEACLSKGLNTKTLFEFKTLESFGGPNIPQHIQKIRYEHYVKKIKSDLTEIAKKRRQIIQNRQSLNYLDLLAPNYEEHTDQIKHMSLTAHQFNIKHADPQLVEEMIDAYNRTMHQQPNQSQQTFDVSQESLSGLDPVEMLEYKLRNQFEKYQRALQKKSKEAQNILEQDVKRKQLNDELEMRENKIEELKEKIALQKLLEKKRIQKISKEKVEKIREQEKNYQQKLVDQRELQLEKIEKLKQKLQQEEEVRKNQQLERELKQKEKQQRVLRNKQIKDTQYTQYMNKTFHDIQNKLNQNEQRYQNNLQNKAERLHDRSSMEEIKRMTIQRIQESKKDEEIACLIQKMGSKEEQLKMKEMQKKQEDTTKRKHEQIKEKKLQTLKIQIQDQQEQRMEQLKERFQKIGENNLRRKNDIQMRTEINKEKKRLKQVDLYENFLRQQKLSDLRFRRLIDSDNQFKQKLELLKLQDGLLSKAQQEILKKQRMEEEILDQSIINVSQTIMDPNYQSHTAKNIKTIKNFFKKSGSVIQLKRFGLEPLKQQTSIANGMESNKKFSQSTSNLMSQ